MKILATSDWHAHNFKEFSKTLSVCWNEDSLAYEITDPHNPDSQEMNSRLFNILSGLCQMRIYCVSNDITDILFGGDMFHHRGTIDVTVFNPIFQLLGTFAQLGVHIHAIAGNHDQVDNSVNPQSALYGFRKLIHVIEQPEKFILGDNTEVVALPYAKDKQFILSTLKQLRAQCENPTQAILLCHLGIDGGLVGSGMYAMHDEFTLDDLMSDQWKYVVVGHYHRPQILSYNSVYCGTPVQNNFGDEMLGPDGYNGFFVVDLDRRWDVQFVSIIAPRFVTLSSAKELEQLDTDFVKNNFVRVKVKASGDKLEEIQGTLESTLGDDAQCIRLELEKDYSVSHRSGISLTQAYDDVIKTFAQENWKDDSTLPKVIDQGLEILREALSGGTK